MSLIDFESLSEIKQNREIERQARQNILDKAQHKYETKLRKEKEAKERGETTWMLPSIEDKISSKKKKKKEKKEKKKKEKKAKKKKKRVSSSSSSSESDVEDNSSVWVEKNPTPVEPPVKRDDWMELTSLFKTQTREQMKIADGSSRALKRLEERKRKEETNKPGSHSLELNPYYKDGGDGLPSENPSSALQEKATPTPQCSYDASWLRKALTRAQNQASEEGRSLEEVAKERWGSLDTFYQLLDQAEGKKTKEEATKKERDGGMARRRSRSRSRGGRRSRSRSRGRGRRSRSRGGRRSRSRSRDKGRSRDKRSRSRDKGRSRSRSRDKGRSRDIRSRSRDKGKRISRDSRRTKHSRSSSSDSSSSSSRSSSEDRAYRREKEKRQAMSSSRSSRPTMLRPPDGDVEAVTTSRFRKPGEDSSSPYSHETPLPQVAKGSSGSWRKKVPGRPRDTETSGKRGSSSSSSGSSSESEAESGNREDPSRKPEAPPPSGPVLTDKEMNQLAAKLTKAELLGNEALMKKLKAKLEAARTARAHQEAMPAGDASKEAEEEVVVLTRTDRSGFTRPIDASAKEGGGKRKKKNKIETFDADGHRVSYFADDFKVDLQTMFEKEKTTSAADQIAAMENLSCSNTEKLSDDFDVDDMFIAKVAPKESGERERERERLKAIWEHQKTQKTLDECHFCVGNKLMKKHLIVALGTKCYVSVPHHQSLTEGHCLIVPLHHVPCGTQADEDLWEEIMNFRQALVRMFSSSDEDCLFFETATRLQQPPHMVLQCVPLPRETGELAPIYFKKAILECDEEWAQNKKLIDLKGRSVRKAVPKGLPYFSVDFGLSPGFAHVVENERIFPNNFAQEIIGGMIDADYSLFRKPKAENFDTQRKKVLKFAEMFKPFDPTL